MANNDQDLWGKILSGDEKSWREMVIRYKSLVYTVCIHSGLSQPESADVFQETWFLLYKNRKTLKDPTKLSSWLVTTAKREAIRLKKRSEKISGDLENTDFKDLSMLPDEQLEALEVQAQLEIALNEIDQPCQKILHLFFFADNDLSYDDLAKSLGYSPNTLGAKRRRCLERLKRILIEKGYFDERNEL